jgi:four helix bundle protein
MAMASASELEYLLLLAFELGMISRRTYCELEAAVKEVKRMLASLIQRIRSEEGMTEARKRPRPLTADS